MEGYLPAWVITIISLVGSTIITTVIGLLIKYYFNKAIKQKEERDAELQKLREDKIRRERKEDMVETITEVVKPIEEKIDKLEHKVQLNNNATLSSLRNSITTCYYKCSEKGYRNDYDYTNIHDMYEEYKKLDGNSYISDIMDRFDALPVKENTVPTKVVKRKTKQK